ncbi:PadR family transcriptional regulator [Sporosarcina sp. ANT_H38]|uniref:PadR family transcriptional regulator n=1 Tax=Sporosarcina sp. ANT_H38 TaxID=2597358 RepID=UPI0011F33F7E|nr:PadR family transcriptional regulator [Sporosarcina sp. ANT_H38]KAA0966340.1 PadR family transcriptional regulator [Sporosarcina sp. ANT_H38]
MSIQVYILGILAEENSYPYMLKKRLSEPIPIDQFTGLNENKLYYHFEKLAAKGHIIPVETIREENRPDKHVYQITEQGRQELKIQMYNAFENAKEISEMYIALVNIKHVEIEKVIAIIERKLEKNRLTWETYLSFSPRVDEHSDQYLGFKYIGDHSLSRAQHTKEWLEDLVLRLKELKNGTKL